MHLMIRVEGSSVVAELTSFLQMTKLYTKSFDQPLTSQAVR